jgi:two-component system sensor histidine kinase BarA
MSTHPSVGDHTALPAYDRALALHQVGGNEAIADELIGMMITELPDQRAAMRTALEHGRLEALREEVHRIHGSASCCGTPAVKQACQALESALLDGEYGRADELHTVLETEIARLIEARG